MLLCSLAVNFFGGAAMFSVLRKEGIPNFLSAALPPLEAG